MAATSSYMSPLNISTLRQIVGLKKSKKARGQLLTVSAQLEADVEQEEVKALEAETESQKTQVKQQALLRPVKPQINVTRARTRAENTEGNLGIDQFLDTTNEFVWTTETCNKVYSCFQELVDHYETSRITQGRVADKIHCSSDVGDWKMKVSAPLRVNSAEDLEKEGGVDDGSFDLGAPPPFKLVDIRATIPKYCWVKDPVWSMSYICG
ncbi:hypothetical protein QQ045_015482 [Rhodiola kirilowii]